MFDWDDETIDHVGRHGISPVDVEEAASDPRRIGLPAYNRGSEVRKGVLGSTHAGRILAVVTAKHAGTMRVVTARDADQSEKKRYRTKGK